MKTDQEITETIMRRVQVVHTRRLLASPQTRFLALLGLCGALLATVSVKNVIINAVASATSVSRFFNFIQDAVLSTEFFVQLFLLGALVLVAFQIRDFCLYCVSHSFFALFKPRVEHTHHA